MKSNSHNKMSDYNHQELAHLSGLIDLIYQGATDIEAWQRVPSQISAWVQSGSCLIFTPMLPPDKGGFSVMDNWSPQTMELFTTKYLHQDIWAQRALERGLMATGNVLRDQELVTEEEFLASTVYREFMAPINVGRVVGGIVFGTEDSGNPSVVCACHRPFDSPFAPQDASKLGLILPHLSRALGVMFRLRDAEFKVASSLAALERLPSGMLLFGRDGDVVFANCAAQSMLDQEDGLRLRSRSGMRDSADLLAEGANLQNLLDEAIREAVTPDIFSTRHFSRAVAVPRPSGKSPFALNFSSLPAQNEFGVGSDSPRAIAFLSDSATPVRLNVDLLKSTYGLTAAEIRTAELVAEGCGLEEVAAQLDVSVNTVKTQLRHIYDKTGTNNRAKLVKLLLALASVE